MVGVHGYAPIPTLDPMAPDHFTSSICMDDCKKMQCQGPLSMWKFQKCYMKKTVSMMMLFRLE